jgi:hypothetical protein
MTYFIIRDGVTCMTAHVHCQQQDGSIAGPALSAVVLIFNTTTSSIVDFQSPRRLPVFVMT